MTENRATEAELAKAEAERKHRMEVQKSARSTVEASWWRRLRAENHIAQMLEAAILGGKP